VNKKVIIGVAVLIVLAVGGYLMMSKGSKNNSQAPSTSPASTAEATPTQAAQKNSIKDLLAKNISQTCTFNTSSENTSDQGTVYMDNGKVRADIDVTANSTLTKTHIIADGKTSYVWVEGRSTGFKMAFDVQATPEPGADSSSTGSLYANAKYNYDCKPWVVDSSLFTVPTSIRFMSLGTAQPNATTQPGGTSGTSGDTSTQCAYCENLTGDSKTQCLTALKCK
jgi:hypothetical protein